METKKFNIFLKKYGVLITSILLISAIILVVALTGGNVKSSNLEIETNNQPWSAREASTDVVSFALPLENVEILSDYAASKLAYNETLGEWSAHKCMDLTSASSKSVSAVLDGVVTNVTYNRNHGNAVTVTHSNGFVSVYGSLANVLVKQGDTIKRGDKLGDISRTAGNELHLGDHLHFELYKDGVKVDPNLYLDLGKK